MAFALLGDRRRVGLLQEAQDDVVELGRLLPVGGVAGAADDVVARAGDEPMAHLDEVRRRDLVVLADEEEDGQAGGVQALVDGEAWRRAGGGGGGGRPSPPGGGGGAGGGGGGEPGGGGGGCTCPGG